MVLAPCAEWFIRCLETSLGKCDAVFGVDLASWWSESRCMRPWTKLVHMETAGLINTWQKNAQAERST